MQAAVGVAQLKKLPAFIEQRKRNFEFLYENLRDLEEFFILPRATRDSVPSWFGFPLAVRGDAPFTRDDVLRYLEDYKIATRLLFGGNLLRQPAYSDVRHRRIGDLRNSDFVMNSVLWMGVWPGLTREMLSFVVETLHRMVKR
jgi:CDP-6-deoxy-D-xylo-4-hexulose-3-dehydrase